jgi:hypothetical protein
MPHDCWWFFFLGGELLVAVVGANRRLFVSVPALFIFFWDVMIARKTFQARPIEQVTQVAACFPVGCLPDDSKSPVAFSKLCTSNTTDRRSCKQLSSETSF